MKINNRTFTKPNSDFVVLPREGGDLVFKLEAILNDEDFIKMCPMPRAPSISYPNGGTGFNLEDEGYKHQVDKWSENKSHWTILQTLRPTDGLEWDRVKYDDPSTWTHWRDDLKAAFLSNNEIVHLMTKCYEINSLTQRGLDEARDRFLATLATPEK